MQAWAYGLGGDVGNTQGIRRGFALPLQPGVNIQNKQTSKSMKLQHLNSTRASEETANAKHKQEAGLAFCKIKGTFPRF